MDRDTNLNHLKRQIVQCAYDAHEGHIPSSFSALDILWVLYDRIMRLEGPKRDRFILSKGHAALALYVILAERGILSAAELNSFATYAGLAGHPDLGTPGIETTTGSLGHGLAIGVGMAMCLRWRGINRRVFVLMGDGECNEGAVWEAALLAAHQRLDSVTCIVDHNHSTDLKVGVGDLTAKFRAFGWQARETDGHCHSSLQRLLARPGFYMPTAIIAHTTKGHGVERMEGNPEWHHKVPTAEEYEEIMEELA